MKHFFLLAGEISGDMHGAKLIEALTQLNPQTHFSGIGGPKMRQKAFSCIIDMEAFQVMGFSDVLKALPRLVKLFYTIRNHILQTKPDAVVLIDYPGFNLRLAKSLRKAGYKGKLIQYICPSVWAHGKRRIDTLEQHFDLLLTIYPFESNYFSNTHLKTVYVGNPIEEQIRQHTYDNDWIKKTTIPNNKQIISLFPGSRKSEIINHLPEQLEVAKLLKHAYPDFIFVIPYAQNSLKEVIEPLIRQLPFVFLIPSCFSYELMQESTLALAKSGTVTLELAMHLTPTIVHYHLSSFNRLIAKHVLGLKLKHYCIVNILADKTVFPEWIEKHYTIDDLADAIKNLIPKTEMINKIKTSCESVKNKLQQHSTANNAAGAILEALK